MHTRTTQHTIGGGVNVIWDYRSRILGYNYAGESFYANSELLALIERNTYHLQSVPDNPPIHE